jgi:hypothetical protein
MATKQLGPESRALREIDVFLRGVRGARTEALPLERLIEREARALVDAHRAGHPAAANLVGGSKYRKGQSEVTEAQVLATPLSEQEAFNCMVGWHWFDDVADMRRHAGEIVDPRFESACDAIVDGDTEALRSLLTVDPSLVKARSRFAHHQTLLQHVAANGIENSRQWQSPPNAVEIAEILLDAGSEPDATCDSYGGNNTAMNLLVSSGHPATAGVQGDLVEALCRAGAKPNGPNDDGMPLWTAISSWYPRAAEALVRCGARVDNLLFAAAVGDLDRVRSYFDAAGRPLADRAYSWGAASALGQSRSPQKALHPEHMVEYALHWAAASRRRPVVEFLLARQPDLQVREPTWNNTILETATYGDDPVIVGIIKPLFEASAPR